ncbi:helix-turn-helix domain-containing protein [Micromonospora zamorensis]|uniref:helix-turn-helix domain-containing protein n=1 Tax=Micromonospora zamorensis TaxID=709883 RepID=UPI003CE9196F
MFTHTLRSAEELEQAAGQSWMPVAAEPRPDFQGQLVLQALGGAVSLSEARMTPLRTFRTERMARKTGRDDLLLFCVHLAGAGHLNQRGRVAELGAGSGVLYEARGAWNLTVATNVHSLLLQFPRDVLPLRAVEVNDALARRMEPGAPAMRLLSGYVNQLFHLADGLNDEQRRDAGLAGIDMLTMALRGRTPTVPDDQSAAAVLLGLMRTHIREHLADPRLTVNELARRHHVSVRHTHVLFAHIGVTPAAYIREERLLAARALLSDPRQHARSMSDIGAAVGLGELRTFERAFQRQFGTTPARWRREQQADRAN